MQFYYKTGPEAIIKHVYFNSFYQMRLCQSLTV